MVNEIQFTSIAVILDDLKDHSLLSNVTLEQVIRYTARFMALHSYPEIYMDKISDVDIEDYRAVLPCDVVRINQVKNKKTGVCMRAMSDVFTPALVPDKDNVKDSFYDENTFKTQGNIIYTSFKEGTITISYKATAVDENGYPMIIDNEIFKAALEAYIKREVFINKFDEGKISSNVLQQAKVDYALLAGQLHSEFKIPSMSEMESLTRRYTTMIKPTKEFDNGFKNLGNREYLKNH